MYFTGINVACYSPGDQCPDNKRYGNVHLVCQQDQEGSFVFVNETNKCHYVRFVIFPWFNWMYFTDINVACCSPKVVLM